MGFPLPERLPNTDRARDRLLAKLYTFREQVRGTEGESDEDFALIYAYGNTPRAIMGWLKLLTASGYIVLVTGRISEGLYEAIQTVERLYGTLEDELLEI